MKVSSFACTCVLFKPEHNAKWGPPGTEWEVLEMEKLNIPIDKTQKVNESKAFVYLSCLLSDLWSLKC